MILYPFLVIFLFVIFPPWIAFKIAIVFLIWLAVIKIRSQKTAKNKTCSLQNAPATPDDKFYEEYRKKAHKDEVQQNRRDKIIENLFCLFAKLSSCDGAVTQEEIQAMEKYVERKLFLSPARRAFAIKWFRKAREDESTPLNVYAKRLYETVSGNPFVVSIFFELLVDLAEIDGQISPNETSMLNIIAEVFEIKEHRVFKISGVNRKFVNVSSTKTLSPYEFLGMLPEMTNAELKKQYRKLALEMHPDYAIAKGLPEDLVKYANERFKEIQAKWEIISKERGIN